MISHNMSVLSSLIILLSKISETINDKSEDHMSKLI